MRFLSTLFCLFVIMSSCHHTPYSDLESAGEMPQIDSAELSKIVIHFAREMKVKKHLELEDSWANHGDWIDKLMLRFSSQRLLTVYDARLILVELVEDLLNRINHNQVIGFELAQRPFTASELDIKINFESYYGIYLDPKYVGCVWLNEGYVYYYAFDHKDPSLNGIDWVHKRCELYTKSRELALIKKEADFPFAE